MGVSPCYNRGVAGNRLLVLFDGNAIVHRAHHAFAQRPLSVRRTGEVVSAVYGFASMLIKAAHELKPSHWAVALDYPAPTFRHRQYEKYKQHRPPQPEELRPQFGRVRELAATFGIPIYEVEGFEADDVLGTLSRQAEGLGVDTVVVTGDTDTMQLVTPRVRVLYIRAGRMGSFSDTEFYDEARVLEKFGVPPASLPDFKGLKGDPSDNIPGVSGIGDKTALRLLQDFGSVDGVYQNLDRVAPPKVQGLLRAGEALALQSRTLARIVTDAPVELSLEACDVTAYDRSRVVELFRELEFSSLLGRLPERLGFVASAQPDGAPATPEPAAPPLREEPPTPPPAAAATAAPPAQGECRVVQDGPALEALLRELGQARELSVDVETTGRDERTAQLVGIALSFRPGEAYYIPVAHQGWEEQLPLPRVLEALRPALTSPSLPKVAHNSKYDITVLWRCWVLVAPLGFDTMVAAHLLGEKSLGLKALAFARLGVEMTPITALIGTGAKQLTMAQVPVPQAARYAGADADMTLRLRGQLEVELRRERLWELFAGVEMPLLPLLFHMERAGVLLDLPLLRELAYTLGAETSRLEGEIYAAVGHRFNINSSPQLAAVLYDELGLPHSRRTKTGYSTEATVLEELKDAHPVIPLLLEYRLLTKLKSTYVDTLPGLVDEGGRVHTVFNQTGTATGRLSSSDPNMQNIPVRGEWGRRIRRAFIAPPGSVLLAGDYSQIDLRVLAHLSQDPALVTAFRNDEDIHTATAAQVFGVAPSAVTPDMRRVAKTVNFGVIYGMSEFGLEQATDLSRGEASAFIRAYFEKYPGVKQYMDSTKEMARQRGYVETLLGRRRYIPDIKSLNRQLREATERMAINMPVQGTTADIMKRAMLDISREMERQGLKTQMLLQVHDELIFEVPRGEEGEMRRLVPEVMRRAVSLSVPLKADVKVGQNWGEME
ncbi:MAG: DNA polymerase I [Chloroflexota bacterium]